jgi:transposase
VNNFSNLKNNKEHYNSFHNKNSNYSTIITGENNKKNEKIDPRQLVFFKVKNKKELFNELESLIKAVLLNQKYTEEYMQLKKIKLFFMKKINHNLKEIYNLLKLLKENLPIDEKELREIIEKELEMKVEKQEKKINSIMAEDEEKEVKKEIDDLEKIKKELKELEEKLLDLMIE